MSEPMSAENFEQSLSVFAVYSDNKNTNDSAGISNVTDFSIELVTVNSTEEEINSFYFYKTEQFTILWILFIMIVLGNSAVLLTLSLNKRRKSRMNFFIKQLAIADLTVGLISVLTDIIWRMTVAWYAGNIACKIIRFLQATVTYSSTYVLVALSIDRYDAITHPMNFTGSWRRARVLVISAWLISILFSIPEIYLFEEKPIEGQLQCWIELQPWQWQVYMTLITIALLIVPAIIISACYTVIVRTIWSKSKLLISPSPAISDYQHSNARRRQSSSANRTVVYRYDEHDTRRASSRGIIPKAKIKTVKMTFVIVFVFILCWSPYIVFDLLQVYGQIPRTQTSTAVATLIQSLAPLNSAANPLIYCLFSTRTCRTLRKLFPLKWLSGCPGFESGSSHCLGGSDTSSRTVTTSLTQHSSRRSTSANQHTIRVQTNNPSVNSRNCKVAISVVYVRSISDSFSSSSFLNILQLYFPVYDALILRPCLIYRTIQLSSRLQKIFHGLYIFLIDTRDPWLHWAFSIVSAQAVFLSL